MMQIKEKLRQIGTEKLNLVNTDVRMKAICCIVDNLFAQLEEYDDSLTAKLVKSYDAFV